MGKSRFILIAALALLAVAPAFAQDEPDKPNVLIILADDLGFADLGSYGGDIQTPVLDRLAEDGLRFSQFYSAGRSASSRVSLLTGYYHDQMNAVDTRWSKTLPQRLKAADYRSYHSGKWQLNRWFEKPIADAGFDRSYHLVESGRHLWPSEHFLDDQRLRAVDRSDDYNSSEACADYMIEFLKEHSEGHKDKPFFAYLALTAPHHPLQADQDDIDNYADQYSDGWDARRARIFVKQRQMELVNTDLSSLEPGIIAPSGTEEQRRQLGPGEAPYALRWFELTNEQQRFQAEKMRIYAAMVQRMDREIGRVITQLRRMREYDNTLILFMSDNGANSEIVVGPEGHDPAAKPGSGDTYLCLGPGWASSSNTPFRRHRLSTHEGGIVVPMIAFWRSEIDGEGEIRHEPTHMIDVVPTVLKMAGLKDEPPIEDTPELPGIDFKPILVGEEVIPERELFFHQAGNRALRQGKWKIVSGASDRSWSLYDMTTDRAEEDAVSRQNPEKLLELTMRWQHLYKQFDDAAQR